MPFVRLDENSLGPGYGRLDSCIAVRYWVSLNWGFLTLCFRCAHVMAYSDEHSIESVFILDTQKSFLLSITVMLEKMQKQRLCFHYQWVRYEASSLSSQNLYKTQALWPYHPSTFHLIGRIVSTSWLILVSEQEFCSLSYSERRVFIKIRFSNHPHSRESLK